MKIYLGTANQNKLDEINQMIESDSALKEMGVEFSLLTDASIEEPEENGDTFEKNAIIKAEYYAAKLKAPCLADDSGLEVAVLHGMPGVHSKRWVGEHPTTEELCDHLLEEMRKKGYEASAARYVCSMALVIPSEGSEVFTTFNKTGYCEGRIKRKRKGTHGFGYDPIFYIDQSTTMAELAMYQKNAISHRGKAFKKIMKAFKDLYLT